jgi:ATP-dependent Clp protease ATP-binding subunit ClpB
VSLAVSPAALNRLAEEGLDAVFGARPLKRVIINEVTDPLAKAILEGRLSEGQTVTVDAGRGGVLSFSMS